MSHQNWDYINRCSNLGRSRNWRECEKSYDCGHNCGKTRNSNGELELVSSGEELTSSAIMVSGKKTDEQEGDLLDCRAAHHNAVTSHADYIPKCSFDGNYEQIQCYKVTHILAQY